MLRCTNCDYNSAQYSRRGNKYGYGGCGCAAASDTEYDNESDEDDDWMVESAVPPPPPDRFRSQAVHDRRFSSHERHSSMPGPPNRQITPPAQASLKFHPNNSFDSDSVCSGTFTIDLSTLQSIQNHRQQARVVNQPNQFSGRRNKPHPRSNSAMAVSDPEPIPYGRETEYRVPYPHPHNRHTPSEHQPHVPAGRQFHDRMTDDPRKYDPPPRGHYNFPDESDARYEPFPNARDYSGWERDPYSYESTSCKLNTVAGGYHRQANDCSSHAGCGYSTDTNLHHVRADGYGRVPRFANDFPDGARREERGHFARNADDPDLRRSLAPEHRCSRAHFNDRYEDCPPQIKGRYDHVPTRDVPPPHMTGMSSQSRSRTPVYHATRSGHVDPIKNRYDYVQTHDDGSERYLPPRSGDDFEPVSQQEPQHRWKQSRFQDEHSVRPRSSSTSRHESTLDSQASLQFSRNTARDTSGRAADFPASSVKSQSYRTSVDQRGDIRHGNQSSSIPAAKAPESLRSGRSGSRDRYPAYQDDPSLPRDVSDQYRSSGYQDRRTRTGQMDGEDTTRRDYSHSTASENKAASLISDRRQEERSRHVKFQSDPDLSLKEVDKFHDSRRTTGGGQTYASTVTSDRGQQSSDRRYQSSESLRGSSSRSRDEENREQSEMRYSSQTSLRAHNRSPAIERGLQAAQRTRSVDRVDRADRTRMYLREPIRSRDSSRNRRRDLPRVPADQRRPVDDEETSSAIRDVTTEITRMTSSVNSIDSEPPDPPPVDFRSSVDRGRNSSFRNTNNASRLTMSTNDLDSFSSTQSGRTTRERLEEQKRKKSAMRREENSRGSDTLLSQIQDDLHSEIDRYAAELGAANQKTSRSVVCEEDPQTSPVQTGNIVNTALIDSQVQSCHCCFVKVAMTHDAS